MPQANEADYDARRGIDGLGMKEDAKPILVAVVTAVCTELAMMSMRYLKEKIDERKVKQNVVS